MQRVQRAAGTALAQTTSTFTYTPNGLPATIADAQNNLTATVYDEHDRLIAPETGSDTIVLSVYF